MLKVMIVDDELIVRVGFRSSILWEDYGCQVVATCESAKEAIAYFQKEVPDIVFTDIMMPGMNGIELVQYIREHYKRVKVVVLSCVNEIEYVKKAIKLGAEDYILKLSFTKDTMAEVITKMKKSIEAEQQQRDESNIITEIHSFNRDDGFRLLLAGNLMIEDVESLLDQLGYYYDPMEHYLVGSFLVDHIKNGGTTNDSDSHMMRYGLLNVIREYCGTFKQFDLVFINDNEIMIVFRLDVQETIPESFDKTLAPLNHALKTHLNLTLSMGMNCKPCNRIEIASCYQQAKRLVDLRFFDGSGSYHDKEIFTEEPVLAKREIRKKIQEAIYRQNPAETFSLIDSWFSEMGKARNHEQIMNIRRAIVETWIFISGYTFPDTVEIPEYDDIYACTNFWEAETLEELKDRFKGAVQLILDYLQANKTVNSEILQFLKYLEVHIEDTISLDEAAGRCALGKSQFCILFKKQTGETFINYFNRMKMERAFVLLSSENIQVQEAATQIGIKDISYFSRLFKKHYDMSPSDVKK